MADQVSICNQALMLLGQNVIQNLTENTAEALACNTFYNTARDQVLREIKPPFVMKRVAPGVVGPVPLSGLYIVSYPLPVDYMLMDEVGTTLNNGTPYGAFQDATAWSIEGGYVLSNQPLLWFKYVAVITGVESLMDASFVSALAAYLAAQIAYAITESNAKVGGMLQLYGVLRQQAENIYGQSQSTQQTINTQLLVNR